MDETLYRYIEYIILFVIFVLPRLLRAFKGKKGKAKPQKAPIPSPLEDVFKEEVHPLDPHETELEEVVSPTYESDIDALKTETASLLTRARDMFQNALARGGAAQKMVPIIKANLIDPLESLDANLDSWRKHPEQATEHAIYSTQNAFQGTEDLTDLIEAMLNQRLHPIKAELLTQLDVAVKNALLPFLLHAHRHNIPYATEIALTMVGDAEHHPGDLLGESNLAAVIVDESTSVLPRGWAVMTSNVYMDVYHSTRGLAHKLTTELGTIPPPGDLSHYRDKRFLVQSLVGAFLPRIFSDVSSAMFLGPGFAFGLQSTIGRGSDEERAIIGSIDDGVVVPMHIRMFAACRTLSHLKFKDEAKTYWEQWNRRLAEPKKLTIKDLTGKSLSISTNALLNTTAHVVDFLAREPIQHLAGYPLSAMPGLVSSPATFSRMKQIAKKLAKGTPQNANARELLGASLIAVEAHPTAERRIGTATLNSLIGKGVEATQATQETTKHTPRTIQEAAHSPQFVVRAIVTGAAFAPRPR